MSGHSIKQLSSRIITDARFYSSPEQLRRRRPRPSAEKNSSISFLGSRTGMRVSLPILPHNHHHHLAATTSSSRHHIILSCPLHDQTCILSIRRRRHIFAFAKKSFPVDTHYAFSILSSHHQYAAFTLCFRSYHIRHTFFCSRQSRPRLSCTNIFIYHRLSRSSMTAHLLATSNRQQRTNPRWHSKGGGGEGRVEFEEKF